jgi:hypothetical protein
VGQEVSAASTFPYYLSYYNPLLGGVQRAPHVMMIGWGEGLDQAARFLNSQAGAENLQVATGVWNGSFSYFFKGQVKWSHFTPGTSPEDWSSSDFYVIYINEWQRGRLPKELMDYLEKMQPVQAIRLQGLEYVRVYDLRNTPPPGYLLSQPGDSGGS